MPTRATDARDDALRREIARERESLAHAVVELRRAADVTTQLRAKLPLLLAGAFAGGFVLAGGLGAFARLVFRRRREGRVAARAGRYALVRR